MGYGFCGQPQRQTDRRDPQKWISWGDTYEVVIYEEDLDDLIIALVVAIDRVKADDAAASSSASS